MDNYNLEQEYNGINFAETGWDSAEYEKCTFRNCSLLQTDISGSGFENCVFEDCDLSMAKIVKTAFREVVFRNCKMLGLHFDDCNDFLLSFSFEGCQLNMSGFYQLNLKNTSFKNSNLLEADFTGANLTNAVFDNCDLSGAVFDNTILEQADLRTAYHFTINPENNRIKKAKFSTHGLAGLLDKYGLIIE